MYFVTVNVTFVLFWVITDIMFVYM